MFYESGVGIYSPRNLKAVKDKITACEYLCEQTIERFYYEDNKLVGGEVIAFILEDGEIFSIDRVEAVLWIDSNQEELWIQPSEYVGFFPLADEKYERHYPKSLRHSLDQISTSLLR